MHICTVDRITSDVCFASQSDSGLDICLFWYSVTFVALQAQDNYYVVLLCQELGTQYKIAIVVGLIVEVKSCVIASTRHAL